MLDSFNNKKRVVFISECKYPNGDASAKRNICLARYFIDRGYETTFVGLGNTAYKKIVQFDDFGIVSIKKYPNGGLIKKIINHLFIKKRIVKYACTHFSNVDLVIVDPRLYRFFKKNSLYRNKFFLKSKVVFSVVEYHSQSEYKFNGFFSQGYRENILFNEKSTNKDGAIIAISRFLQNHFESKGFDTIRIPFVIDKTNDSLTAINYKQTKDTKGTFKRTFIYCGNPRNKDMLKEMLLGFLSLDFATLNKIELLVIGVNYDWLDNIFDKEQIDNIKRFATFYGKIPYAKVVDFYSRIDFSILLRPFNERYSKAGFPTKITESLEFGVPPVTNFTSDLELYLEDNVNCIQVFGEDGVCFSKAIKRAVEIENDELIKLKHNALKASKERLNIRCFYAELDNFIKKIQL